MRFPVELEQQIYDVLKDDADACIVLPDEAYRDDGNILIHRDNMSQFLHRYLYRRLVDDKLGRNRFLAQTCETPGCASPFHREESNRPPRLRLATHCPNGHEYTEANTLPEGHDRCLTCKMARRERRHLLGTPSVGEINAAKTHCPYGHEYTEENTYLSATKSGGVRRKCRTCGIERTRLARANATTKPETQS